MLCSAAPTFGRWILQAGRFVGLSTSHQLASAHQRPYARGCRAVNGWLRRRPRDRPRALLAEVPIQRLVPGVLSHKPVRGDDSRVVPRGSLRVD